MKKISQENKNMKVAYVYGFVSIILLLESLSANANWVLCLESVYWYNIYVGGQPTSAVYIGTANMIGGMQKNFSGSILDPIRDSWINKLTNGLMSAQGYGMIQAWPVDGKIIIVYNIYCECHPRITGVSVTQGQIFLCYMQLYGGGLIILIALPYIILCRLVRRSVRTIIFPAKPIKLN